MFARLARNALIHQGCMNPDFRYGTSYFLYFWSSISDRRALQYYEGGQPVYSVSLDGYNGIDGDQSQCFPPSP